LQGNSLVKLLKFRDFSFVVFAGKQQPKHVGKCQKLKKSQLRSDDDIRNKILAQCSNFDVSGLGLQFQVSSLGVFDEVAISKF